MNILFLTNNSISYKLINWLKNYNEVCINVCSEKLNLSKIIDGKIDLIVCYNYRYLIEKEIINHLSGRIINLHISFLPWNKGAYPNVWSFLENTPKGITIHLIDEGLDTGDIIFQKEIFFNEREETLKSSYELLHDEIQKLFIENWKEIKNFTFIPEKQIGIGSFHSIRDFKNIEFILEDKGWNISIQKLIENYKKAFNN